MGYKKFDAILLRQSNAVYKQNNIEMDEIPFLKKSHLVITKNYRGITLTAKVYNGILLNRIRSKIEKILCKNQNGFCRNRPTTSQILTIHQIIEKIRGKNLKTTLVFVDFSKAYNSKLREKME